MGKEIMRLTLLVLLTVMIVACQKQNTDTAVIDKVTTTEPCTKELKVCEDGQTVGRDGNNHCEFFSCPPPLEVTACQEDMKQCPDGSFVFRNQSQDCQFEACPSEKVLTDTTLKACTKELKVCENGNSVGRNPANNCEFNSCESLSEVKKEAMLCTQEVKQCADGSYVGRDSYNNCQFKPCPEGDANLQ